MFKHNHTDSHKQRWVLRGCWFSEMPQVRCHIHRNPGSKLRPLCFFTDNNPPTKTHHVLSIRLSHVTLFIAVYLLQFSPSVPLLLLLLLLLSTVTNKVSSVLFIISNNRGITQVLIWAVALYESNPALGVRARGAARECSFNHLGAPLSKWEKERGVNAAEITRSGQLLGVNNDAVVSEMTELCFCFGACRPQADDKHLKFVRSLKVDLHNHSETF